MTFNSQGILFGSQTRILQNLALDEKIRDYTCRNAMSHCMINANIDSEAPVQAMLQY